MTIWDSVASPIAALFAIGWTIWALSAAPMWFCLPGLILAIIALVRVACIGSAIERHKAMPSFDE
jgi:hypothetical protein